MAIQLNHTIVHSRDALESARFLSDVLALPAPVRFGHFQVVSTDNGVSLDFMTSSEISSQHYAFLVTEEEFDAVLGRVRARDLQIWADPGATRPGEISEDHGRGFYFQDPSGHYLEVITQPYDAD